MAELTTELMEELLKMIDAQQLQDLAETRTLCSRPTTRLKRSPTTKGIPASRTNFIPDTDSEPAQSSPESNIEQARLDF